MGKAKRLRALRAALADSSPYPAGARSFELKLVRAQVHLQEIEDKVGRWVQSALKTLREESDPDDARYQCVWIDAPAVDDAYLSLLAGDCLQCLRSMLDHLAFELAAKVTIPMTDDIEKDSAFPILSDIDRQGKFGAGPHKWQSTGRSQTRGMAPRAQAEIERLQPYHRGHAFGADPLWQIGALNNIDKHRALHVVGAAMSGATMPSPRLWRNVAHLGFEGEASVFEIDKGRTVEGRTRVARLPFAAIDPRKEVHMGFAPVLDIAFAETTELIGGVGVVGTLKDLHDYIVSYVLPPLVAFLK